MYTLANNVLGRLKYDITGAATSLVVEPLAGTQFNLPPAPTAAGSGTYGKPFGIITLIDRLDSSAAKIEHVLYTARAAELAGAYTLSGLVRGWEGSAAQAWTAGAHALQMPTEDVLGMHSHRAINRSQATLAHDRDSILSWDGAAFKFGTFRASGVGRGRHFSTTSLIDISMPANGTTVSGVGGASNTTVASGAIPIAVGCALYYEPNISGGTASIAANFRLVGISSDYVVPAHWIFLAMHSQILVAGEAVLRVGNGATLSPWRAIGAGGEPGFTNSWVNQGTEAAAFQKDVNGFVRVRGTIKSGTIAAAAFTLPVGYRPGALQIFPAVDNGAFAELRVTTAGGVTPQTGSGAVVYSLNAICFPAAA